MLNKRIFLPLLIFILSIFQFTCVDSRAEYTDSVDVLDVRKGNVPEVNLASHKHDDIEVFRTNFLSEGYKVRYYQLENKSLAYHEAFLIINEDFDKAAYKRLSDTSVAIRLFNSATKKEKKIEVYGSEGRSGIRD